MIENKACINVWSDSNMDSSIWIDFCVVVYPKDLDKANEVVERACDDWWESIGDAQFEPIADYVSRCLYENGIEFDIYYKDEEEMVE